MYRVSEVQSSSSSSSSSYVGCVSATYGPVTSARHRDGILERSYMRQKYPDGWPTSHLPSWKKGIHHISAADRFVPDGLYMSFLRIATHVHGTGYPNRRIPSSFPRVVVSEPSLFRMGYLLDFGLGAFLPLFELHTNLCHGAQLGEGDPRLKELISTCVRFIDGSGVPTLLVRS
jgi:hypothetical protein